MATINEMRQVATQIENETTVGCNTAERVGGLFNDIVDELESQDDDIDDIKDTIGTEETSVVTLNSGSVVRNAGSVGDTADMSIVTNASTTGWYYGIINVSEGEKYRVAGYAGNQFRLWCVINSSNVILATTSSIDGTPVSEEVTITGGASKLVVNINGQSGYSSITKIIRTSLRFVQVSDVANTIARGNMNPVTSNAVAQAVDSIVPLVTNIQLNGGSAIKNSGNIGDTAALQVDTNEATATWSYGLLSVNAGEKYVISGYAGNTYRIYCIVDSSNRILDVSVGITDASTAYVNHVITIPQGGVKLAVNINGASGYSSIGKVIASVDDIIGVEVFGYRRSYDDITHALAFERKTINNNAIEDSTVNVLAEIPNNGVVEVKMNAPLGKFKLYKFTSNTYTELTDGWSHYVYRYAGDYTSQYYVVLALQAEGTLTIANSRNIVKVYMISDIGARYNVKDSSLYGKSVAFFGDSIVQGRFCKYGTSVNMCMPSPYSNIIGEMMNNQKPANYGIGGALVYNNDWKSLYRNCTLITGYDVVFVHAGTNDYGGNTREADFTSAYTYVIQTLVANNTKVVVVTPTPRTDATGNNARGMKLVNYANIEKTVASTYGCTVIDLNSLLNSTAFKNHLPDGLHPDEAGHAMIAETIIENYV